MKTLKIIMTTDCSFPAFGGIESHIHYLSDELVRMGHKVYVITHYSRRDRGNDIKIDESGTYTLIKVPGNIIYRFGADISFSMKAYHAMEKMIDKIKPDIIHGHSVLSMLVYQSMHIARKRQIPFVITKHSLIYRIPGSIRQFVINNFNPLSAANRYISAYMGVSGAVLDELPSVFSRKRIIFNGIDRQGMKPVSTACKMRNMLGIDNDNRVIGFVSRLIKQKGVYDFINTVKTCYASDSQVKGIMVGDGPEFENIRAYIKKIGMEKHIVLPGHVPHSRVGDYFQLFDYFFLPSCSEGLGIVLIEAMNFNALVLTYDAGGTSEIVRHGENGYIVSDSANAAMHIMKTPPASEKYASIVSAAERTASAFTWENVAGRVLSVYREFVN